MTIFRTEDTQSSAGNESAPTSKTIRRGWGEAARAREADAPYAQRLKYGQSPILIKFLENEPYATYNQHWVDRQGQRSFVCLGDDCPLCEAGSRPTLQVCFNVIELSSDNEPRLRSFQFGPRVYDQVANFHNDPRQGPIDKHYWAISKSGEKSTAATNFQMVRERDLAEEWQTEPLSDAVLEELRSIAYTSDIIQVPTRSQLLEIAAEDL